MYLITEIEAQPPYMQLTPIWIKLFWMWCVRLAHADEVIHNIGVLLYLFLMKCNSYLDYTQKYSYIGLSVVQTRPIDIYFMPFLWNNKSVGL